ncbi:Gfo/Idh/MocA family oxidoreductase [Streptomyces catenulae]|uniref:Gfo/Idh/MocA family oxidoreductase n=1 Tax=Streptomyces catenulae TaxID=66875 RepID=A0ABV2YZH1_9ACTN|nr:Gfo/Idh/MocA family oxidoreductase [Streptomyces catenulae]
MHRIRVGVLGCGMIAQLMHLPYLTALRERFDVTAVCDRSFDLAEAVAQRFRVPRVYASLPEMLDGSPEIDAVAVLNADHVEPVLLSLRRSKHVFTEKPLGYTVAETEEVAAAGDAAGVTVMVGYMKRYDSGVRRGLAEIARLTRPLAARLEIVVGPDYGNWIIPELARIVRSPQPPPGSDTRRERVRQEIPGSRDAALETYMDMFGVWSHDINLLRAAFPASPDSIKAHASEDGTLLTASLRWADGPQCTFLGASTALHRFEESLTVWGEDRTVRLDVSNPFLRDAPSTVRIWRDEPAAGPGAPRGGAVEEVVTGAHDEAFRAQWEHFHECVTTGRRPLTDARGAVLDTRLMRDIVRATEH